MGHAILGGAIDVVPGATAGDCEGQSTPQG